MRAGWRARTKQWLLQKLGRGELAAPGAAKAADRQAIKDDFQAKQNKLTDLTREQTDLEKKLALDLGPQGEYLPLVDQCAPLNPLPPLHISQNECHCKRKSRCRCLCAFVGVRVGICHGGQFHEA